MKLRIASLTLTLLLVASSSPAPLTNPPALGAATAWGDIIGTLADQLDLQAALDAKSGTGHTHSGLAPTGGTTGQVLKKASNADYDYAWDTDATGGGGVSDGDKGDVVVSGSGSVYTVESGDVDTALALAANPANCANAIHFATGITVDGTADCEAIADVDVPNNITIDSATTAGTATALAANPADCVTATHFAVGIDASGVPSCEAISDADVPNTITVDLATLATTATTANAGDSATAFFSAGTIEVARGGTGSAPASDDQVLVSDSSSAATWRAVPDCDNATSSKVLYDTATNTWTCGTDQTSAGGATTLTSTLLQSDAVIATYTAITGLSFTPAAATNYLIDCYIIYTSSAATTGINFAWDVPAGATSILMTGHTKTVATGANEGFSQNSDNVGTATSASIITVQNLAYLSTIFRNGATSATMSLGFTPETANSVSVIAGSVCQYRTF
jgi:hypothetical protein